jgi:hypothetical protein
MLTNKVIATIPIGQAAQAVNYVPNAVPEGAGIQGLLPLGIAGQAAHLTLAAIDAKAQDKEHPPTSVTLFDQGLIQVLQASVIELEPKHPCVLALSRAPDGSGDLEPLAAFNTNPAGSTIVDALGPIRQMVRDASPAQRRYLVIVAGTADKHGAPFQLQQE